MQPDFVPQSLLHSAMAEAARRKPLPGIGRLRIERFDEGLCAQILHVGPFADARRTDPSRWKTVLRQPME